MSQFIGYCIDGYNPNKVVPLATGTTKEECMTMLCRRVLTNLLVDSSITVQQRDDVPPETFAALTAELEKHFSVDGKLVVPCTS